MALPTDNEIPKTLVAKIKGTPAVKLKSANTCDEVQLKSPGICEKCRQVNRWLPRVFGWKSGESKFKAITRALLDQDDDILKSICSLWPNQEEFDCHTITARHCLLGMSLLVSKQEPLTKCTYTRVLCQGGIKTHDCTGQKFLGRNIDRGCTPHLLCPCENEEEFALMKNLQEAYIRSRYLRPTGSNILEITSLLFPNSNPQLVSVTMDEVCIYIGRELTELEECFESLLLAQIPRPFCTSIGLADTVTVN